MELTCEILIRCYFSNGSFLMEHLDRSCYRRYFIHIDYFNLHCHYISNFLNSVDVYQRMSLYSLYLPRYSRSKEFETIN